MTDLRRVLAAEIENFTRRFRHASGSTSTTSALRVAAKILLALVICLIQYVGYVLLFDFVVPYLFPFVDVLRGRGVAMGISVDLHHGIFIASLFAFHLIRFGGLPVTAMVASIAVQVLAALLFDVATGYSVGMLQSLCGMTAILIPAIIELVFRRTGDRHHHELSGI